MANVTDGYPKWAKNNTSTIPDDPENQINRAKGEPEKAAPGVNFSPGSKTVNDGITTAKMSRNSQSNEHYPPCINPTCKSFGKSHPNCLCYSGPGGSSLEEGYAEGGRVCSGPHHESCEHYADGGQVQEQQRFLNNPGNSIDHVGAQHGLLHLWTKLGHNGQSPNSNKYLEDYMDASKKGHKTINTHINNLLDNKKSEIKPDLKAREQLKEHIKDLQLNPEKMLDIGGNIGNQLPGHAAILGSHAANAFNYLQKLKPQKDQNAPLDPVQPESKMADANYNRALDIANNPALVLHHVKNGTVQPLDLTTIQSIYPDLHKSMVQKSGEALIKAKTEEKNLSFRQKRGLGDFLGKPLEFTATPMAMQAIMMANRPVQSPQSQGKPKKASGKELDQINKTENMLATPDQSRLMDKKE